MHYKVQQGRSSQIIYVSYWAIYDINQKLLAMPYYALK